LPTAPTLPEELLPLDQPSINHEYETVPPGSLIVARLGFANRGSEKAE
jgi:hypothetical protein